MSPRIDLLAACLAVAVAFGVIALTAPSSVALVHVLAATTAAATTACVLLLLHQRRRGRLAGEISTARAESRFRALVHNSSDVIVTLSPDASIRSISASMKRVYGHDTSETIGRDLLEIVHPEDRRMVLAAIDGAIGGGSRETSARLRTADGAIRDVQMVVAAMADAHDGEDLVVTIQDVTQQLQLQRRLRAAALNDPLTDLPNRALMRDRIDQAISRRQRATADAGQISVLFIDLDDFKVINERLGQAAGDEVLTTVGRRLETLVRDGDTVARLGGDEFGVLLEDVLERETATSIAERIVHAVSAPITVAGQRVSVSASVGISCAADVDDAETLLRQADTARYAAKSSGKGRWVEFVPSMEVAATTRNVMRIELPTALERDEFVVEYQPIIDLGTNEACGMEALIRWEHPVRGRISPLDFIPHAEESGLIVAIGRWVLEQACRDGSTLRGTLNDPDFYVTVNVSATQLHEQAFVDDVRLALAMSGLPPAALVLELTESVLMIDTDMSLRALLALRALGVRVAVDDFGTGYCSLAYLRRFPLDMLKVDRAFVVEAGSSDADGTFLRVIHQLADTLRLTDIAEGVETQEQAELLRGLGVARAQGFLFASPAPIADLLAGPLVRRNSRPVLT